VEGSCKSCNEVLGSIKCWEVVAQLEAFRAVFSSRELILYNNNNNNNIVITIGSVSTPLFINRSFCCCY
jgi:hypothetical protein